ncbi:MAG TPA: tetratricopeptide repeat protein [Streptosporangiaceae bacterium]|jgi:tetratricopeptide (TPR) repeat protein
MTGHLWLIGPRPAGLDAADSARGAAGPADAGRPDGARADVQVSCHHLLRGPYTGLGAVLRALVPGQYQRDHALVRRHAIEILAIAPDLEDVIGAAPQTLTSVASMKEQTRIYPPARTRRLAHGVVDFLLAGPADRDRPLTLSFSEADQADQTDQEFLAILLRRARPERLTVIARTSGEDLPAELAAALDRYARAARLPAAPWPAPGPDTGELVRAFVDADGTATDPAEIAAYQAAGPADRAALHDARAARLRADDAPAARLGAIPYHLEHGSDPAGAGGAALLEALDDCFAAGYYHAVLDYGSRGQAVTDPGAQSEQYWLLTGRIATSLAVLDRPAEAEKLVMELRARYSRPDIHVITGYSLAMMYTRYFPPERKDHHLAKAYINNAIALSSLWPDPVDRAFQTVFNENGLALIEMHLGNMPEAIRLVTEGRERLDRELAPDVYLLHRSVLIHNRANVLAAAGRLGEALADFDTVIEMDPNYTDYYLDRATIRRRLGDAGGAMADYDTAIARGFPLWELHYNRGDLRAMAGHIEGAIADFGRVVELEPGQLDARINLADLLIEAGALAQAAGHLAEGLRLAPGDPRLLCAKGRLAAEAGDPGQARRDFDLALAADGGLVAALAGRAGLAYEAGDMDAAAADLTRAIDVAEDPDLLYNRGRVHQEARRWQAAADDFSRALRLPGADQDELRAQQAACQAELAGLAT